MYNMSQFGYVLPKFSNYIPISLTFYESHNIGPGFRLFKGCKLNQW